MIISRWGCGKTSLWRQTKKCLHSEFLKDDAQLLYNVSQLTGADLGSFSKQLERQLDDAARLANKPFQNAVERLLKDPYISQSSKGTWKKLSHLATESSTQSPQEKPLPFMECIIRLFVRNLCCNETYAYLEPEEDEHKIEDEERNYPHIQRIRSTHRDALTRHNERVAVAFVIFCIIFWLPVLIIGWPIYLLCSGHQVRVTGCSLLD